jgi:hypothetical protein
MSAIAAHETISGTASVPEVNDAPPIVPSVDDELIREGEAAVERFKQSREQILPMARGLAAAKRKYRATQEFGDWLKGSRYWDLGGTDRAALINIGDQLDANEHVIVGVLADFHRLTSPRSIWMRIAERLGLVTGDDDEDDAGRIPESGIRPVGPRDPKPPTNEPPPVDPPKPPVELPPVEPPKPPVDPPPVDPPKPPEDSKPPEISNSV